MTPRFTPEAMPFHHIGGEARVRELAKRFYDHMDQEEPALARLHEVDEHGRVSVGARDRFATFLVEWLGGPAGYTPTHGHPRLRMRHARLPVDAAMRDAWLRCMARAMDDLGLEGDVRVFLDARFGEVAEMLRNVPDPPTA